VEVLDLSNATMTMKQFKLIQTTSILVVVEGIVDTKKFVGFPSDGIRQLMNETRATKNNGASSMSN
jgi:hypothetical protein